MFMRAGRRQTLLREGRRSHSAIPPLSLPNLLRSDLIGQWQSIKHRVLPIDMQRRAELSEADDGENVRATLSVDGVDDIPRMLLASQNSRAGRGRRGGAVE